MIGRDKIREFLKDCPDIADLGCNERKIREDADGYDNDTKVNPDFVQDLTKDFQIYSQPYDGICISHFLEHMIKVRWFLKLCYKGLKDEGKIAIIVPDGETVDSRTLGDSENTHEILFTPTTLRLYLENAGFEDVETYYYNRPYAYKQTKGIFATGVKR